MRPARRYDSPSSSTAATASKRASSDSGGVPPWPGGRGGSRWAMRAASQPSTAAATTNVGSMPRGPDLQAASRTRPWSGPRQRPGPLSITDTLIDGCCLGALRSLAGWAWWRPTAQGQVRSRSRSRDGSGGPVGASAAALAPSVNTHALQGAGPPLQVIEAGDERLADPVASDGSAMTSSSRSISVPLSGVVSSTPVTKSAGDGDSFLPMRWRSPARHLASLVASPRHGLGPQSPW